MAKVSYTPKHHQVTIKNMKNNMAMVTITVNRISGTVDSYCQVIKKGERTIWLFMTDMYYEACDLLTAKGFNLNSY